MKSITVLYFAVLREQRGMSEEKLETDAETARALYAELSARHGFSLPAERLRVVVNDAFAPWDAMLADGDTVVFVPPVAGG
ncbi:MAG: MoaD/ThiS family protein [Candidatus Hydrogenedentes bacterium]|nr:MoaD/ThiS family protein [Candidatus Hydrogenedentota bacterium]